MCLSLNLARSRLHVQLRWCTITGEWLLRCLSKRGKVWVDGLSVPHGHAVSLRSGALIQVCLGFERIIRDEFVMVDEIISYCSVSGSCMAIHGTRTNGRIVG